jgi:Family of unknown function (DUF5995)
MPDEAIETRMQSLIQRWEESSDQRSIFLKCYSMMTHNMHQALRQGEFSDPHWVDHLIDHFAGYYFVALEAFDLDPVEAPVVWRMAHLAARDPDVVALQKLLLGVNAHINYDLVLALVDLLKPEWRELSDLQQQGRYADYCQVNEVIGRTIDSVQDQVLEPVMPVMALIDRLFGPLDEKMISSLLKHWREHVWQYTVELLVATEAEDQARLRHEMESEAIKLGHIIGFGDGIEV